MDIADSEWPLQLSGQGGLAEGSEAATAHAEHQAYWERLEGLHLSIQGSPV